MVPTKGLRKSPDPLSVAYLSSRRLRGNRSTKRNKLSIAADASHKVATAVSGIGFATITGVCAASENAFVGERVMRVHHFDSVTSLAKRERPSWPVFEFVADNQRWLGPLT